MNFRDFETLLVSYCSWSSLLKLDEGEKVAEMWVSFGWCPQLLSSVGAVSCSWF